MHADTPDRVLELLAALPVSVPNRQLHQTGLIVNLRMDYGDRDITRQVSRVTLLEPGPTCITLAQHCEDGGPARVLDSPRAADAVRGRTGFTDLDSELDRRRQTIRCWMRNAPMDAVAFREQVVSYYRGHTPAPNMRPGTDQYLK